MSGIPQLPAPLPSDIYPATEAAAMALFAADDEPREIARRLEAESPNWLVLWGAYTHQFVAFPRFDAPRGTIVTAIYPDALVSRTREVERQVEIAEPASLWTVWIDEMAAPLHKVQHRQDAERILLDYADHDYMYIESPAGEQHAWNHSRRCWERVD